METVKRPGYVRPTPKPSFRVHSGRSGPTPLGWLNLLGWVELGVILALAILLSEIALG